MLDKEEKFIPKNGPRARVVVVARISTDKQDPRALDDQIAKDSDVARAELACECDFHIIQSQGSGEWLDRKELDELKDIIESGTIDLVITEDLGRICRRHRALDFCELCADHGTRLIAINDRVDTEIAGWQDNATLATWHHERSNRDTSERIKRSLNNRFDGGQLMESIIYGYIVPAGATSDLQVRKDPKAEPVIEEIFRRLLDGAGYSEIADWLNQESVPLGPYCRVKRWNCAAVSRLVHNRLLKGERIRNRLMTERVHKTGRHRSKRAPVKKLRIRKCPHLAFFAPEYYDHVVRTVDARNSKYRRGKTKPDQRKNVPKSRTAFPGQHIRCGVCGRLLYWTLSGSRRALICSGATAYRCWNSLLLSEQLSVQAIRQAILDELRSISDFDAQMEAAVLRCIAEAPDDREARKSTLEQRRRTLQTSAENLANAIEQAKTDSPTLVTRLDKLETEIKSIDYELHLISREPERNVTVPNHSELCQLVDDEFAKAVADDQEAIRLLRRLIPTMYMVPYRCCDGRGTVCRIHLEMSLVPLLEAVAADQSVVKIVTKSLIVDSFDVPQKAKFLTEVLTLKKQGLQEREIGARLGITQAAVQHVMKLWRAMQAGSYDDPYLRLYEVPVGEPSSFRRHLHPRFHFEPLAGFPLA